MEVLQVIFAKRLLILKDLGFESHYRADKTFFTFQESDVKSTLLLLEKCAPFYHSGELTGECLANPRPCVRVPPECVTHNAVFTILHFLTDDRFLAAENVRKNN